MDLTPPQPRTMRRTALTALLAGLAACSSRSAPTQRSGLPDVILVTLDTTRADRLGTYGYTPAQTDTIDALAEAGRVYEHAWAPVPLTIPSHAAIHTGRYPASLGIRGNGDAKIPDDAETLAEVLHQQGYTTAASVAAFVTTRTWGFGQGFDAYFDALGDDNANLWHAERRGDRVVDDAIEWWTAQPNEKPRFLWVHLYDAHFPYEPPPAYAEAVEGRMYDGELAFVDDQIARLKAAAAGRSVLWVLVGDHGEALGEHGELTHGLFVYAATQRVPFILSGPGIAPARVRHPVSLIDLAPTVLSTLGLTPPAAMTGQPAPGGLDRPIYLEAWSLRDRFGLAPHLGVVNGQELMIDVPRPELYNLNQDAAQAQNIAVAHPDRVKALKILLDNFGFTPPERAARGVADPEVTAQLAALGYTDGGFEGTTDGALPDAKDHTGLIRLSQRGERLDREEKYAEAATLYRTLLHDYPHVSEFRNRLAIDLDRTQQRGEAITLLREVVDREPDNYAALGTLAALLGRDGQHETAALLYERCVIGLPYSDKMRAGALSAWLGAKRPERVLELGEVWMNDHPNDDGVKGLVGLALLRNGDVARAEPLLLAGAHAHPPPVNVALRLAELAIQRGDREGTTRWYLAEVLAHPQNESASHQIIPLLSAAKRWDDLARAGRVLARAHPSQPVFWHAAAQAEFNLTRFDRSRALLNDALKHHPTTALLVLLDANLLDKEGQPDRAKKRFAEAQALHARSR